MPAKTLSVSHPKPEARFELGEILLVDKPRGWTSFDVVRKIQILTHAKTGHAGTLDPLATGLLICCTGKLTKRIRDLQGLNKEYRGTMVLGATTTTYDLESAPRSSGIRDHPGLNDLQKEADRFVGEQWQVPPAHSAVKKEGIPLYRLARKGLEVAPPPRRIQIHSFELLDLRDDALDFRVVCSSGTYIRSLVHDFGNQLGCGAYLSDLCRTRIGEFQLRDALTPQQWHLHLKPQADREFAPRVQE